MGGIVAQNLRHGKAPDLLSEAGRLFVFACQALRLRRSAVRAIAPEASISASHAPGCAPSPVLGGRTGRT